MPKILIESILQGQSPFQNFAIKGQFSESLAIDPDLPATSGGTKASGFLVPVPATKISSTTITNSPLWITSNPKIVTEYVYDNGGKVYSMTSAGVVSTTPRTLATSGGNGTAYYDNYYYYATNTEVARFGPLDGAASWTLAYWTSTLSKTALVNTTYPTAQRPAIAYPNHPMHVHKDSNRLYFGDVVGNQGVLHYIQTSKTTVEGDTNNGSTYNALDLPYGWWPTDIESYNTTEIAIAVFEGNASGANTGGRAKVVFWDEANSAVSWNREAELPDEYCSALKNVNGTLYAFSGNLGAPGVRVSRYLGGTTFEEIAYLQDSCPPFPGAISAIMNRALFGGFADLSDHACVWAVGSKINGFSKSLFNIMRFTGTAGTGAGTSSIALQGNNGFLTPKVFLGWSDGTNKGIDLPNTTYGVSTFRSEVFRIGMPFKITKIRIPLGQAVASNMTLIPKIYVDDEASNTSMTTINSTNYTASERNITYKNVEIYGKHNFFLELNWSGTALLSVGLPIIIEWEPLEE